MCSFDSCEVPPFTQQFQQHLEQHFEHVMVMDQRGDGHFLQMVIIDPCFADKSLVERSRIIFTALGDLKQHVHAYSVKGFTPEEWEEKKEDFQPIEYKHLH